jgi:mRNA-degrading endonuclease RelE of RelBE toxin-antitoxin system
LTAGNEAYKSDVRGYFLCCPLCGSEKLSLHLVTIKPHVRSAVVGKRFLKDLKGEKAKELLREALDYPDADFYELQKFEEQDSAGFRGKAGEGNVVYCVDKNKRVIFMRVFKKVENYKKFIEVDGSKDTLSCYGCGAKWHLYIGITGLKWAELDLESEEANGAELLGKKLDKNEWLKMAQSVLEKKVQLGKKLKEKNSSAKGINQREN